MPSPLAYNFRATLWLWEARRDLWTFVTLPDGASEEIHDAVADRSRGFGAVRVRVRIGTSTWCTSVFPQAVDGPYVLPVKRTVREAEAIELGDEVDVSVEIRL